ncbi:MAG: hypothetical protein JWO40_678 [Candidatus Doudnabacteria bacterium]|nr:hypothetical protein [Candidatus Doudnabacteria bacterium]
MTRIGRFLCGFSIVIQSGLKAKATVIANHNPYCKLHLKDLTFLLIWPIIKTLSTQSAEIKMQTNVEKKGVYKVDVYREFIRWSALPPFERARLHLSDQGEFAEHYNINQNTLTHWKNRADFKPQVDAILKQWGRDRLPAMLQAMYNAAIKGNAKSQRFWMAYIEGFDPKILKNENQKSYFSEDDMRTLIDKLPEWLQNKYNSLLMDLLTDSRFFSNLENDMSEAEYEQYNKDNPL